MTYKSITFGLYNDFKDYTILKNLCVLLFFAQKAIKLAL